MDQVLKQLPGTWKSRKGFLVPGFRSGYCDHLKSESVNGRFLCIYMIYCGAYIYLWGFPVLFSDLN